MAANVAIGVEQTITIGSPLGWTVVAALLIVSFVLARRRPAWGLGLVIAALPLYQVRGEVGSLPTTLLELLFGAVALAVLSRFGTYRLSRTSYDPWLALWLVAALVAAVLSPDPQQGLGLWRAFFLEPTVFFLLARAVFAKEPARPLLVGAMGAIAVTAVWTLGLLIGGSAFSYDDRLTGPFQSPNFIAHLTVPLLLLIVGWPERLSSALRYGRYVPVAVGMLLLLGSQSRGGLIAAAIGAATLISIRGGTAWLKRCAIAAVIVGLLALTVLVFSERSDQFSTRTILWETAADIVVEQPLLGVGPDQFQAEVRSRIGDDNKLLQFVVPRASDAHNIFLVTWTEWGLFTLLGFIGLLVAGVRQLWRRQDAWVAPAAAMGAAILCHGLIDTPVFKNDLAFIFMLVLVLTLLPKLQSRRPSKRKRT